MNLRCSHCWKYLGLAVTGAIVLLEQRGFTRGCHPTLSRELAALGPVMAWSFPVIGGVMTWHLLTLPEVSHHPKEIGHEATP